jgi:hypothetical protein
MLHVPYQQAGFIISYVTCVSLHYIKTGIVFYLRNQHMIYHLHNSTISIPPACLGDYIANIRGYNTPSCLKQVEMGYLYVINVHILYISIHLYQAEETSLFSKTSRLALGPTQPPIRWLAGFRGVKRPGGEVNRSPPFYCRD